MTDPHSQRYSYDYPRPALTVDVVVIAPGPPASVLLARRAHPPFAGTWSLPGGYVEENEPLAAAARRELAEETGLSPARLRQIGAWGDPGRDPRGWTVTVAYLAEVDAAQVRPQAGTDAAEVAWFPLDQLPPLAFDHAAILAHARAVWEGSAREKQGECGSTEP